LSAFIKKLQNLMAGRISSFQTGNHVFTKGRKASAGELGIRIEGKPYLLKRDPFDAILPELADVLAPLQGGISKIRRSQPKLYYGFVALWEGFVFQYIPYHDLLPLLGTAGTPLLALGLFTLVCAVYWLMHPMMRWTVNKRNPWIKKISLGREILNTWQRTKDHYQRSSLWMVFVLSTLYLLIWIPLGPTPALAVTAVTHATWDYNAAQQRKGDPLISKNIGEQILKNKMAIHPADQVWYVGGDLDGFGALNRALSKTLLGHLPGESDSPDLIEARESIFLNLWTELNKIVRKVTAGEGVVFRGDGGDEFAMVLIGSRDEIQKQLDEIVELFNNAFLNRYDFYSIKGDTPLTDKEVASLHKTITHRFDESFVSLARFSGGLTLAVKKDKTLPASSGLGLDNGFNPLSVDTLKVESPELKVGPFTISLGAISMADVGEQMGDGKSLLDNRQRVPKGEEGSFLPWAEQLGDTVVRRAKHQGKNRGEIWSKDDVAAHRSQFADSASVPSPTPTRAFTHFYLTIKKTIENPLMTFFDLHLGRLHSTPTLIPLKESFIDSLRLFIHQHQGKPVYVYRVGVSGYQSLHEERAFHTLQEQISHIDGDIVIAGLVDFLSTVFKVENFTKSNAGWVRPDSFYFFTDKKIPQESLRVEELIALVKSRLLKHNPSISQEKIYQDFNPTLVVYETIIKKGWLFKEKINEAIDSLDLMNDVFIMGVGHQIKNTVEHQSTSLRSSSLIGSPDERFDFAGFPVSLTSNRQNGTIVTRGGIFPTSNRRKKISSPILAFQIKDQCIWVTALPATKKGLTHILEMEQGENQTKALAEIEASLPPKARKSVEPKSESETGQDFEDRFTEPSRQAFIMETTLLGGKASQVDWTLDRFTEIIQTHLRDDSFAPTGTRFLALTPEISVGASDEETITTIDLDPLWDNRPDQTVPNLLTAHVAHELDEILVSDTKRTLVVHTSGPQTVKQIKHLLEARFPGLRNLMGQVGDRFVCVNNGAENGQTHLSSILRRTTGHPPQKIKATIRVVAEDPTLIAWDEFDRKQVILIPVLKDFIERIQRSFREIHHRLKQA